jgi:hypothetical protein
MRYTPAQVFSWTNDIRQLVETNHVSEKRIRCALQWYKKHIGEQYCPVIESGSSLRNKFTKLESAIGREQYPFEDKSHPPIYDDGIKYVWDAKLQRHVHSVSREIYIP